MENSTEVCCVKNELECPIDSFEIEINEDIQDLPEKVMNAEIIREYYDNYSVKYSSVFTNLFIKNKNNDNNAKKTMKKSKNDIATSQLQYDIQHKRDLMNIHNTLSVSHIHKNVFDPNKPHRDGELVHIHPVHFYPKIELCMEFLWCFPCCFYCKNMNYIQTYVQKRSFETHSQTCQTYIYDIVQNVFYTPLFDNTQPKSSKLQKMVLLIRFCFELYKTMIGSYLTIFTPQNCQGMVCTLTENLIPKDNLEVVALTMNSFMAFSLLCEYAIEIAREKILRLYFENDPRLPVEKEYFTNLLGILDTKKAILLGKKSNCITLIFKLYRRVGIILLSLYVINVSISAIVIYKNYYDKSSMFGFVTNALFIVLKMVSILKIAIHSIHMPYSAYIETPVSFNSLKPEYIKSDIKKHFLFGIQTMENENVRYFDENKQYIRFLLDDYGAGNTVCLDIDELPTIRHRNSFG